MTLRTPLAYDIQHLYPNEYKLGRSALHMLRRRLQVELPEQEAVSITLHIINAEAENGDMHATMQGAQVISRSWRIPPASPWTGTASTIPALPCTCGIWCSG